MVKQTPIEPIRAACGVSEALTECLSPQPSRNNSPEIRTRADPTQASAALRTYSRVCRNNITTANSSDRSQFCQPKCDGTNLPNVVTTEQTIYPLVGQYVACEKHPTAVILTVIDRHIDVGAFMSDRDLSWNREALVFDVRRDQIVPD